MNLIKDPWIWVVRKDGTRRKISPLQITSQYKENPVIRVDFPRPDFSAMATQFLIALIQTYFAPFGDTEWKKLLKNPLSGKALLEKFGVDWFNLDGEGYRFMQDLSTEDLIKDFKIQTLFFESPGESTVKEGRDFFKPDSTIDTLCPSCAAIALYSKQINSTAKGQGWNTSIRSSLQAPLNTLIVGDTLWETIIYNVLEKETLYTLGGDPNGEKFPWLERTVDSSGKKDDKEMVSLEEKAPCYPLWEMPCRYHLVFEKTDDCCDVCGDHDTQMVKKVKGKNCGNKYIDGHHTLSPSFETKVGIMFRGAYPNSSNTDYPTFMDCLIGNKEKKRFPAPVVSEFMQRGLPGKKLWAFGYILDKAKYFGWVEKTWKIPDVVGKETSINELIFIAVKIGYTLESYVKSMLMTRGDLKSKKKGLSSVREDFYKATEASFYVAIENPDLSMWLHILVTKAFEVFDHYMGDHKIGLQIYKKGLFIEIMNKDIAKKKNLSLLKPEDLIKRPAFKRPKLTHYFTKEIRSLIMSWWKRQDLNRENHSLFSKCASVEEFLHLELFSSFMEDFKPLFKSNGLSDEVIKRRMAAGLMILSRISSSRVILDERFSVQLTRVNSRHALDLFRVKDPLKEWKTFESTLDLMSSVNIISFLENFVSWNQKIRRYWERIYRTVNQ